MSTVPPTTVAALPIPAAAPRRRRWLRGRLSACLTLLLLLVAAAPTMIARTGLRHQLFGLACPGLPDGITIGSAQLGWFSPVVFREVMIPDLAAQPLLTAAEIRTDRPLWELIASPGDIGRLTVRQPTVRVVAVPGGSNLQAVLDRLESAPGPRSRPRLRFECSEGRLTATDAGGQVLMECADIRAVFDDLRQGAAPAKAELSLSTSAPTPNGRAAFSAEWTPATSADEVVGPGAVELQLTQFPLDPLLPVLRDRLGATACAGQIQLAVRGVWDRLGPQGGGATLEVTLPELAAAVQSADPTAPPLVVQTRDAALRLVGRYDGAGDRVTLTESSVRSEWFDGVLTGTIGELRGRCACDVAGEFHLKDAAAARFLPADTLQGAQIEGLGTRRIAVRGPLRPAADTAGGESLAVEADVVWRRLAACDVESEDAEARLRFAQGRIETSPTRVPVSGGRLVSVPIVALDAGGPRIEFTGRPILEQVAFSDAMCRGWMRYLSPLMADATSIDGRFSLAVDAGELAVPAWPNAALGGTLSIHSARVGPGPLTRQILGLVQQIRGLSQRRGPAGDGDEAFGQWLTISDQQVAFAVRNGRVEHRNLRMLIGPVSLDSQGSVGLADDSLDLQLRIRFPDSWFANRPLLAQLRGDGLVVPIRGTLSQPQVESRPLLEFGRGIGLRAVDGILQRALER